MLYKDKRKEIFMKICVYAISKNEEKFVSRWYNSMKEADEIYVLDTGSTDNTIKALKEHGIHVQQEIISPWRFDTARNKSLELIPEDTDICVCTDLDEVFLPGWRHTLEQAWTASTTRARYNYNWSLTKDNKPIVNFYIEKIHTRHGYKWIHPVHEVLEKLDHNENTITIDNITLNHYPDSTKSRSSYLPLLEESVKEDPEDDRSMHYLGREYMYYKRYEDAIKTLKKHLTLEKATWKDERSASMRFISRCYKNLKNYDEAKLWLEKAMEETPYLRDPFVERALLAYQLENYFEVEKYCLKALRIKKHAKTYINETFSWDSTIYDLLAITNYVKRDYDYALYFIELALDLDPENSRLLNNKKIFIEKLNN